jgi:hypothetical protein
VVDTWEQHEQQQGYHALLLLAKCQSLRPAPPPSPIPTWWYSHTVSFSWSTSPTCPHAPPRPTH